MLNSFLMDLNPKTLPVFAHLGEILKKVEDSPVTILTATPGSGKTLLVAPHIVKNSSLRIAMLQPRRVAARMSAQSIASLNQWSIGKEVGLIMKDTRKVSDKTRLTIMTEGVLSRMLCSGHGQKNFDLIILDEFHERSVHTDLACAWIKKQTQVKLLVMSATLDMKPLLNFFPNSSQIHVEGRAFPIKSHYLQRASNFHDQRIFDSKLMEVCERALELVTLGSIVVFLPGQSSIKRARNFFQEKGLDRRFNIEPHVLYGSASRKEQLAALAPSENRKIIFSTNIAETSLTIPNVRAVIDSGLHKEANFNPVSGVHSLSLSRIGLDGATQRAGRAGRLHSGHCFKMWTKADEQRFKKSKVPELQRIDPTQFLLQAYRLMEKPSDFEFIDSPATEAFSLAQRRMGIAKVLIGDKLSNLGEWLSQFPGDFSLGLLIAASSGKSFYNDALLTAVILQEGDPTPFLSRDEKFQLLDDLRARLTWLKENSEHPTHRLAKEFERKIQRLPTNFKTPKPIENLEEAITFAFPHRICRFRDKKKSRGLLSTGRGVKVARVRPSTKTEFFIALKIMDYKLHGQTESDVQFFFDLSKKSIFKIFEESIKNRTEIETRKKNNRPKAISYRCFWKLPLEEPQGQPLNPSIMAEFYKEQFAQKSIETLKKYPESQLFVQRSIFCSLNETSLDWPAFNLEDWGLVVEAAQSETENLELEDQHWLVAIKMLFTEAHLNFIESFAPLFIKTRARAKNWISYENPERPKVSIILQEAFEFKSSPMIGKGTVPLSVELLAPSRRPMEISSNMKQFWVSSYPEIRKQYRGRYPKHAWPEKVE